MAIGGDKKPNQGGKYDEPDLLNKELEHIEMDKIILHVTADFKKEVQKYVFGLKMEGEKRKDSKADKMNLISVSTWGRDLMLKELRKNGIKI